jgi:hypothetical protein
LLAPRMTLEAAPGPPRYSRIDLSWSAVGGASVTSRSNSTRSSLLWAWWELAWSSVAWDTACAFVCLSRVRTRVEAVLEGLWKRVTTFFAPCWEAC